MTPTAILDTLNARGARLLRLDGDRLAVEPRSAVDDALRQAIREQKSALLRILTDPTPTPPPCAACRGVVHWRRSGTAALHCAVCDPCPDARCAYWYLSDEWEPEYLH